MNTIDIKNRIVDNVDMPIPVEASAEKNKEIINGGDKDANDCSTSGQDCTDLSRAEVSTSSSSPSCCGDQKKKSRYFSEAPKVVYAELSSIVPGGVTDVESCSVSTDDVSTSDDALTTGKLLNSDLAPSEDTLFWPPVPQPLSIADSSSTSGLINELKRLMITFAELDSAVHKDPNGEQQLKCAEGVPIDLKYKGQYYLSSDESENYDYIAGVSDGSIFFVDKESKIRYSLTDGKFRVLQNKPDGFIFESDLADILLVISALNTRIDTNNLELVSSKFAKGKMAYLKTSRKHTEDPLHLDSNSFKYLITGDLNHSMSIASKKIKELWGDIIHLNEILTSELLIPADLLTGVPTLGTSQDESPACGRSSSPKAFCPSLVCLLMTFQELVDEHKELYSKKPADKSELNSANNSGNIVADEKEIIADFSAGESLCSYDEVSKKTYELGVWDDKFYFVIDCAHDVAFVLDTSTGQLRSVDGSDGHVTLLAVSDDVSRLDGCGQYVRDKVMDAERYDGDHDFTRYIDDKAVRIALYHFITQIYGFPYFANTMEMTFKEKLDDEDAEWLEVGKHSDFPDEEESQKQEPSASLLHDNPEDKETSEGRTDTDPETKHNKPMPIDKPTMAMKAGKE